MKDPRGVERGACTQCCCGAYELEEGAKRAACSYCEHPAPAHVAVVAVGPVAPNNSLDASTSDMSVSSNDASGSSAHEPVIVINMDNQQNFLEGLVNDSSTQSNEPTSDEIEALLPTRFRKNIATALANKALNANHKTAICQQVVVNLYNRDRTSNSCLKKAAKKMTQRWSPFKNNLDPDCRALYEKLKRRRGRLNMEERVQQAGGDSGNTTGEGNLLTSAEAKEKMFSDWAAGNRQITTYRENMAICRQKRQEEAKRCPGLLLLRQYPALALTDLVLEEFVAIMATSKASMAQNWSQTLPHLIQFYLDQKMYCITTGTLAEKTVPILEGLHKLPLWIPKKQLLDKRSSRILEVFPENTPLDEMRPHPKDPPRLLATGSAAEGTLSIQCYLDNEPFFSVSDPMEAVLLLLAAYFLMGIKWPPYTRLPLIFLCCATIGPSKVSGDVSRNNKLIDFLKKMKLM